MFKLRNSLNKQAVRTEGPEERLTWFGWPAPPQAGYPAGWSSAPPAPPPCHWRDRARQPFPGSSRDWIGAGCSGCRPGRRRRCWKPGWEWTSRWTCAPRPDGPRSETWNEGRITPGLATVRRPLTWSGRPYSWCRAVWGWTHCVSAVWWLPLPPPSL